MIEITIHRRLTFILQALLMLGLVAEIWSQQWFNAVITSGIILITFAPLYLQKHFHVFIPAEFVLIAIAFIFASLFLGEIHDYYTRYWWWDIALHTVSGVLLGIVGFLLVYVLNETEKIGVNMKPGFVAFLPFCLRWVLERFGKSLSLPWMAFWHEYAKANAWRPLRFN